MIDFTPLTDRFGDAWTTAIVGAVVGLGFGILAQRSRFCARSAVIEVARGAPGQAVLVWLAALGMGAALAVLASSNALISLEAIRLRAEPASLSGALVGGLMFGVGMVLARGCASRHLVLAASGNLRAWVTFGLFALTALATVGGPLAPVREAIGSAWMIGPQSSDLAALAGVDPSFIALLGGALVAGVVAAAAWRRAGRLSVLGGAPIGVTIVAGWVLTSGLAAHTFEPTPVKSAAFTAPAASLLHFVAMPSSSAPTFDVGLIPGTFLGAFAAAGLFGDFRLQWFASVASAVRYIAGAVLMGFGGVLAVGCTIGALSNAVLMITVSWAALAAILIGGGLADRIFDARVRVWRPAQGGSANLTSQSAVTS